MKLIVYADGASRPDPGPSAIGVSVCDSKGKELYKVSKAIGPATNNEAEYRAAIEGLRKAQERGASSVELRLDSELVVLQISGDYQVREPRLKPLHATVKTLIASFKSVNVCHVPREQNSRADALASEAFDTSKHALLEESRR